ncbi:hypothetical protein ACIP1V_05225 [Kocuria marina]|uniref:hypothetical protein n=1 Tax=Kocuria marina TaxID=223184 RepID=UPI0037F82F15
MIESLTSTSVERTVEVILSVLLFMDALGIRDAPRRSRTPVLRALFLALPLSLIAVFFSAMYLLPDVRLSLCLVLACIRDATWSHRAADRAGRRPARARGCHGRASGGHPDGARGMNRRGSAC